MATTPATAIAIRMASERTRSIADPSQLAAGANLWAD
jgi:hypothetical protein